jgi:hypothetical protein
MTANATRGEVSLTLDGTDYVLRPSFDAICAFEAETGHSAIDLTLMASSGKLHTMHAATIVAECIKAQGRAVNDQAMTAVNAKRIGELIHEAEGGQMIVFKRLELLLTLAVTGGYTATGEIKAAAMTATIPAAE